MAIKFKMLPTQRALICSIFLILSRQTYMGNINLSRNFIRGHSKSTSLCKIAFFEPRSSVSFVKKMTNHGMTQKNVFLSIYGFLSISHIKGCRNCRYNLCVHSLFHIDAQVLTSYFCKIVEL